MLSHSVNAKILSIDSLNYDKNLVLLPLHIDPELLSEIRILLELHPELGFKDEHHFIDVAIQRKLFSDACKTRLVVGE